MEIKVLCLRGGTEHKLLKINQFSFGFDDGVEHVTYTENGSRNRSGSYKDSADDNKIIKQYADQLLNDRCYVSILKLYIQKLPHKIQADSDSVFYWKAKDTLSRQAFSRSCRCPMVYLAPIGRNQLSGMVKKMFDKVGILGKTNHSLRATGATRLFEANVPEKLIQERTGHRTTTALRKYKRMSMAQEKAVSMCTQTVQKYAEVVDSSLKTEPVTSTSTHSPQMFKNCTNCTIKC